MKHYWELYLGLPLVALVEAYKWSLLLDKFDLFVDWIDRWVFGVCMVGVVGEIIIQVTMWIVR